MSGYFVVFVSVQWCLCVVHYTSAHTNTLVRFKLFLFTHLLCFIDSKVQARFAFAIYLSCIQRRLLDESHHQSDEVSANEQMVSFSHGFNVHSSFLDNDWWDNCRRFLQNSFSSGNTVVLARTLMVCSWGWIILLHVVGLGCNYHWLDCIFMWVNFMLKESMSPSCELNRVAITSGSQTQNLYLTH